MRRRKGNTPPNSRGGFIQVPTVSQGVVSQQVNINETDLRRQNYYYKWLDYMERMAMSRFEWKGFPDTVDTRYLEYTLLTSMKGLFFEYGGNLIFAKATGQGELNFYGDPTSWQATTANGITIPVEKGEGVMVWSSEARRTELYPILLFADELADFDIQKRANRLLQRAQLNIVTPEESRGDAQRMINNFASNVIHMITRKRLGSETGDQGFEVLKADIKYVENEMNIAQTAVLNEFYSSIGVEHMGFEKKAHMLESEAAIATDAVARIREDALLARRKAAEAISERFGLDITVEWRIDQQELIAGNALVTSSGGGND